MTEKELNEIVKNALIENATTEAEHISTYIRNAVNKTRDENGLPNFEQGITAILSTVYAEAVTSSVSTTLQILKTAGILELAE